MIPTTEQAAIVATAHDDTPLVIEAGAGTGKTSTLRLLAQARPNRRMLYVAFNKAIQLDANGTFPPNVDCRTAHSLAFRTHGRRYAHRVNKSRLSLREVARILRLTKWHEIDERRIMPKHLASLAQETVLRFCRSADDEIKRRHVPRVPGIDSPEGRVDLVDLVLPKAEKVWDDLRSTDGKLWFTHDHYLKMWQLSKPMLGADVVLFDEAQDADPAIADVVARQWTSQQILVGDRCQGIYRWRGNADIMSNAPYPRLPLTKSWRFGQAIADEANVWLDLLDSPLRLDGNEQVESHVTNLADPGTVLCRTNAQCVAEILAALENGRQPALVGGTKEIRKLAEAAASLIDGNGTDHPELFAFKDWDEVREYVDDDPAGSDLRVLVRMVDQYGADQVIRLVDQVVDEAEADIILSTAHKAKGREWSTVRVAPDFPVPEEGQLPTEEQAMLAYVTVTRAKRVLDNEGLAWVHTLQREAA